MMVDVSEPGRPAVIGVSPALTDDEIRDVYVAGIPSRGSGRHHVYVAAGYAGLKVEDVSNSAFTGRL